MNDYQTRCKPSLSRALLAMGLDKTFHRAQGTQLYYFDENSEQEVEILDLLGGYGATLLGHNHPALVEVAIANYTKNLPFNNQFSIRNAPALLAKKLNDILKKEIDTHEDFLFSFCSTGAEAIELAIEHAEVFRMRKQAEIMEEVAFSVTALARLTDIPLEITQEFSEKLNLPTTSSASHLVSVINSYNQQKLAKPGHFVALENAFHGKLTSSIQLTHGEMYRGPFSHLGLKVHFIPVAALADKINPIKQQTLSQVILPKIKNNKVTLTWAELPMVSGLFVEPVQGEGGIHCLDEVNVQALHFAKNTWRCPLIADEVQSGSGRCGSFLAGKAIGLNPDYVVLSKALGGGIAKIGVVAIKQSAYADGFDLVQSSTFGEDEHSAEIALAYINQLYLNENFVKINSLGERLKSRLEEIKNKFPDIIADVRGRGLLLGIEFKPQNQSSSIMFRSMDYQGSLGYMITGFIFNQHNIRVAPSSSAPSVIRLEPNICMTEADIDRVYDALIDVCQALQYQDAYYFLRFLSSDCSQRSKRECLTDFRPVTTKKLSSGTARVKVAFINHLISTDWFWQADPSMNGVPIAECDHLVAKMDFDWRVAPLPPVRIKSIHGGDVDFIMYPLSVTSEQIKQMMKNNEFERIRQAVNERVVAAQRDGCQVAGLGMFTSVVTNNCKSVRAADIGLTTGNSLTVAMSIEAVVEHLNRTNTVVDKTVIIGAGGNIGAVYAAMASDFSEKIIFLGSGRNGSQKRLMKSAYSLYQQCWNSLNAGENISGIARIVAQHSKIKHWLSSGESVPDNIGEEIFSLMDAKYQQQAPVQLSNDINDISDCKLIICATNASDAFIDDHLIQQGAIICDVSVPHNIDQQVIDKRKDITCIRGGVVSTPNNESLDTSVRAYLENGQVYACMAETMVLGLEGCYDHYSYGDLTKEKVVNILNAAKKHGFSLASIKNTQSM